VRILGQYESVHLVPVFLNSLTRDADSQVRAAAATALSWYIYLGEIDELPEHTLNEIADQLMLVYNSSQPAIVRRRALEALGYSSREEIPSMIETAYYSNSHDWIVSALCAMGRSLSSQWIPLVMDMLENDDPEIMFEAVRAAGELEIKRASPLLMELLDSSDSDIRMAAVWSLSQIGGEGIEEALADLYEDVDDDKEAEIIEQALDNLRFTEDGEIFAMFDYDEQSDQDDEEEEDIDEIEDEYDPDED
jgi:HEAT repeat protein